MRKYLLIILAAIVLALGLLDAPAYVRCTHLGLCEFLEIPCLAGSFDDSLGITVLQLKPGRLFLKIGKVIPPKDLPIYQAYLYHDTLSLSHQLNPSPPTLLKGKIVSLPHLYPPVIHRLPAFNLTLLSISQIIS